MPQEEILGTRDRTYSAWHRRLSTARFVGMEAAQTLGMIDLDAALYVEYDDKTKEPLMLVETARDNGQEYKTATVTRNLARRTDPHTVPAYCLLYTISHSQNPADEKWPDIEGFRVRRLWPEPATGWRSISPEEWAHILCKLRKWGARRVDDFLGFDVEIGNEPL